MKYSQYDKTTGELIRTVDIPDAEIQKLRRTKNLSTKAIINLWLATDGNITDAAIGNASTLAPKTDTSKTRKRAADETKRELIRQLEACLSSLDNVGDVSVTNVERLIAFSIGADNYELTLSKKRKPKT